MLTHTFAEPVSDSISLFKAQLPQMVDAPQEGWLVHRMKALNDWQNGHEHESYKNSPDKTSSNIAA